MDPLTVYGVLWAICVNPSRLLLLLCMVPWDFVEDQQPMLSRISGTVAVIGDTLYLLSA